MTFQLTDSDCILRIEDNAFIPPDQANIDYQQYQAWLAAGNEPEPAPEQPATVELTPAEKLAAAGLTVNELKTLLGI